MNFLGVPDLSGSEIFYDDQKTGLNVDNVQDAIDLLSTPSGGGVISVSGSSTNEEVVVFNGTTGQSIKSGSGVVINNGQVKVLDGLPTAPPFSFNSDPTSGFYKDGNNINFSTQGNRKLQVSDSGVLIGDGVKDPSSVLDINSTTQGFRYPRMTTIQRDAIVSPATGLTIYNTDSNRVQSYTGALWNETITNDDHTQLQNIGVNSHDQIDTHISDDSKHRVIDDITPSTTTLYSGQKIQTQFDIYDSHVNDLTLHRVIDDGNPSLTTLLSGSKIQSEFLSTNSNVSTNQTNISNNTLAIGNNTTAIQSNDTDILNLQNSLTSHTGDSTIHFTKSSISHNDLQDKGTLTHSQIDTHVGDLTLHRVIDDNNPSLTTLLSGTKIQSEFLSTNSNVSTNTSNISNNTTAIQGNDTDILNLQNSLSSHTGDSSIHFTKSSISHNDLQDKGTLTHSQIDSHVGDPTLHRVIDDVTPSLTTLLSGTKIQSEFLATNSNVSTNTTNISNNTTAIQGNDTDILNLQNSVSTNTTNISTNTSSLSSHIADLTIHQTKAQILDNSTMTGIFKVPQYTTIARQALTPQDGQVVYDTDLKHHYFWKSNKWRAVGILQPQNKTTNYLMTDRDAVISSVAFTEDNVLIGDNVGTGLDNAPISWNANVGIGNSTLQLGRNRGNVAVGFLAHKGTAQTDNIHSVAVGLASMQFIQSGENNTGLGAYSQYSNVVGDDNTCLGFFSGYFNLNNDFNTLIGSNTDVVSNSTTNGIALGYQAIADTNECVIGNGSLVRVRPTGNGNCDLGSSTERWNNLYTEQINCSLSSSLNNVIITSLTNGIDNIGLSPLKIGQTFAPSLELSRPGQITKIQGILNVEETSLFKNTVDVQGSITLTGTVDGRDVALDGTNQDTHIADTTIHQTKAQILQDSTMTGVFKVPQYTTIARQALTPQDGQLVYDTDLKHHYFWKSNKWRPQGILQPQNKPNNYLMVDRDAVITSTQNISQNVLIGDGVGTSMDTATGEWIANVGIGTNAFQLGRPVGCVAIGLDAHQGNALTQVNDSVAVGTRAMQNIQSGFYNTSIGAYSQVNNVVGKNNVSVGYNSGINNLNNDFNTLIGANTEVVNNGTTNGIALGYQTVADSNECVIGNVNILRIRPTSNLVCDLGGVSNRYNDVWANTVDINEINNTATTQITLNSSLIIPGPGAILQVNGVTQDTTPAADGCFFQNPGALQVITIGGLLVEQVAFNSSTTNNMTSVSPTQMRVDVTGDYKVNFSICLSSDQKEEDVAFELYDQSNTTFITGAAARLNGVNRVDVIKSTSFNFILRGVAANTVFQIVMTNLTTTATIWNVHTTQITWEKLRIQ